MKSVVRGFLQIDERMISLISLDQILDEAVADSKVAA
jgi:chemotaxis signal transduction protein